MNETRRAIIISTGMDNLPLLAALKENETMTGASLTRVKGLYAKLAAEKAALEAKENDASLARLNRNMAEKAAIQKAWIEKQAVTNAIASGSGGSGSGFRTAEQVALDAGGSYAGAKLAGSAGEEAGEATKAAVKKWTAEEIALGERSAAKETGHATREAVELVHMSKDMAHGDWLRFFSTFGRFLRSLSESLPTLLRWVGLLSGIAGVGGDAWNFFSAVKSYSDAKDAAQGAAMNKFYLGVQTANLGGAVGDHIDALLQSGSITPAQADRLRSMSSGGDSDSLRQAQRFLMGVEAADAEKKAKAEKESADAGRGAAVAAADKAASDKAAAEDLKKQVATNLRLAELYKEHDGSYAEANKVDREAPTLEQLAGHDYTKKLSAAYGEGGIYDLSAGDGPFAGIAQQALLAKNQQMWDVIHGNAVFDDNGQLIGGQAFQDRKKRISFENMLSGAGYDTPAQQFDAIRTSLDAINTQITSIITGGALKTVVQDE
jgi:hypothetical protein